MSEAAGAVRWAGAIVGFVVLAAGAVLAGFVALMLAFVSDSCGPAGDCNLGLIVAGMGMTGVGPAGVFVASAVIAIVRARRGRAVLWVPWAGIVVAATVAAGGVALAFAGAPPGF